MEESQALSPSGRPLRSSKIPENAFDYVSKHQPTRMALLSQASTTAVVADAPPSVPRKKPAPCSRGDSDTMPDTESESERAKKRQKKGKAKVDDPEDILDFTYDQLVSEEDRRHWLLTMLRGRDSRDFSEEDINNLEFLWHGRPDKTPTPKRDVSAPLEKTDSFTIVPGGKLPSFKDKIKPQVPEPLQGSQPGGGRLSPRIGAVSPVPGPSTLAASQARVTTRLRLAPSVSTHPKTSEDVPNANPPRDSPGPEAEAYDVGPDPPGSPLGHAPSSPPLHDSPGVANRHSAHPPSPQNAPSSPEHIQPGQDDRLSSPSPPPRAHAARKGRQPASVAQADMSDDNLPDPQDVRMSSDREQPEEPPKRKGQRPRASRSPPAPVPEDGDDEQSDFEDVPINVPIAGLLTMRQRSQRRWFGRAIPLVDRLAERLALLALTKNPFADCTPVIVDDDEDGVPIADGVEFDQIVTREWAAVNHELRPGQRPFKFHDEYRFNVKQVYTQIRNAIKADAIGFVKTHYDLGPHRPPKEVREAVQKLLDDNFHSSSLTLGPNEFRHGIIADTIAQSHFSMPGKSIGYRFAKCFKPMPRPTIALHCTIIYFLITTFSTGQQNQGASLAAENQRHWFKYFLDQLDTMALPDKNPTRMSNIQRRLFKQVYQVRPVRQDIPKPRRRAYDTDSEEEDISDVDLSDQD